MTPSAVCFGAKDDSYGAFKIVVPGKIVTFKLTYLNGSVSCYKDNLKSKWGCEWQGLNNHNMGTLITDSSTLRILSKTEHFRGNSIGCLDGAYYNLPWATPDSPELRFDNFTTPLSVTENQEFQVWFGEDLIKCSDSDNGLSKTCADVRGLYV